jgi:hypothetical protein
MFNTNTLWMKTMTSSLTKVRAKVGREAKLGLHDQKALPKAELAQDF